MEILRSVWNWIKFSAYSMPVIGRQLAKLAGEKTLDEVDEGTLPWRRRLLQLVFPLTFLPIIGSWIATGLGVETWREDQVGERTMIERVRIYMANAFVFRDNSSDKFASAYEGREQTISIWQRAVRFCRLRWSLAFIPWFQLAAVSAVCLPLLLVLVLVVNPFDNSVVSNGNRNSVDSVSSAAILDTRNTVDDQIQQYQTMASQRNPTGIQELERLGKMVSIAKQIKQHDRYAELGAGYVLQSTIEMAIVCFAVEVGMPTEVIENLTFYAESKALSAAGKNMKRVEFAKIVLQIADRQNKQQDWAAIENSIEDLLANYQLDGWDRDQLALLAAVSTRSGYFPFVNRVGKIIRRHLTPMAVTK